MVIIRTTYEKQKGYYDVDISDPFTPCDHSEILQYGEQVNSIK